MATTPEPQPAREVGPDDAKSIGGGEDCLTPPPADAAPPSDNPIVRTLQDIWNNLVP